MAGMTINPTLIARAGVDLLPGFGALGGRSRNVGPNLCPTGH
ncbi:MAG TPA: hypothetical protein VGG09_04460 [Acidimicrobiales bacterium]|jgi:hypothetical protein